MLSCWKNNSGTTVGVSSFVVTQERLEINKWLQVVTWDFSSLTVQITSSSYLAPLILTQDGWLFCFQACFSHFLISEAAHTSLRSHSHTSLSFHHSQLTQLSPRIQTTFSSEITMHGGSKCLLTRDKTAGIPLSIEAVWLSVPPFSSLVKNKDSPLQPNKGANTRKWLMQALCWLDEGSSSTCTTAPTTGCNTDTKWQSLLFIVLF